MTKSISSALTTHLTGEVTTLATCWRVARKDGREFFFTDHDRDLAFDGNVYLASSGYSRSAIANDAGMAVDNLDVEGVLDDEQISEQDLRAGLFDHAEVHVFLVNWADLSQGNLRLRRGWFGEVHLTDQGLFRTELRGMTQALSVRIGELYSPECRADLGDHRCRVPIEAPLIARGTPYAVGDRVPVPTATAGVATSAVYENRVYRCITAGTTAAEQPVYDTTIDAETTDGTAVFVAEDAWSRAGTVTEVLDRALVTAAIDEPRAADGWFDGGVLTWETGDNAGRAIEVKSWVQVPGEITLFLPPGYPVQPGDAFRVHPGCDKRLDTCSVRFANVLNFRGEPYVPGQDEMMKYPDAK